jgi:hypothetical protein
MALKVTCTWWYVAVAPVADACVLVPHGITLQVHRPEHLHGWSIHFTSTRNKKP